MYYNLLIVVLCLTSYSGILCNDDELTEGSECISEEGMVGLCVDIHKCMQYVHYLREKNKHPQICSFNGQIPIVCCTDCQLVNNASNVLVDRFGLHYFKTGRLAHDKSAIELHNLKQAGSSAYKTIGDALMRHRCTVDIWPFWEYYTFIVRTAKEWNSLPESMFPECLEYIVDEPYPCNLYGGVQRYLDDDYNCYGYTPTVILAVAGGLDAVRGQYPHMALLGFGDDTSSAEWLCGGTLISHRYVLTAAHCKSTHHSGLVKYIALGILKRSDPPETWQIYNVYDIIIHPEYNPPSKYHDIALLVTDRWVKFTHLILPACLDTGDTDGSVAYATGWGSLGHRKNLSDTLQTVTLNAYSEAECSSFYPPHRLLRHGYNHTTQMCYGDQDEVNDTCQGDSGGPLQVLSELSSCVHTVIGVTSHGKSCGFGGGFGVYSRVSYYVPWIEDTVWR